MADIDDMLLELKDTTDLMVDLAYSSLLYNNVEIAEEVVMLSDKMSDLADSIQNELVGVVKANPDEASRSLMTARLMDSMLDIADATGSIADTVIRGLADHPVLAMSIRGADTTMCLAKVLPDSILAGKTFGELSLSTNSSMFVIAIRRDGGYIFGPDHAQRIEVDDILIAKGPEESVSFFKDLADGTAKSLERCRFCDDPVIRDACAVPYVSGMHDPGIRLRFCSDSPWHTEGHFQIWHIRNSLYVHSARAMYLPATAPRTQTQGFATKLATARGTRPSMSIAAVSTVNVDIVVNAPNTPVNRSSLMSVGMPGHPKVRSARIREPIRFTANVAHGNWDESTTCPTPKRRTAPIAPPTATSRIDWISDGSISSSPWSVWHQISRLAHSVGVCTRTEIQTTAEIGNAGRRR